jgi:hypothetical protein
MEQPQDHGRSISFWQSHQHTVKDTMKQPTARTMTGIGFVVCAFVIQSAMGARPVDPSDTFTTLPLCTLELKTSEPENAEWPPVDVLPTKAISCTVFQTSGPPVEVGGSS